MTRQQIISSETVLQQHGDSLHGKTILITGVSNDSIAGELAKQLSAADPALLILSAREEQKVASIVDRINRVKPAIEYQTVDSLSIIEKIDHFVAVAGVMVPPYGKTRDGFETQFGVNYVANFILVKSLLPKIEAAGPASAIIVVASAAVRGGKIHFDDIGFSGGKTYEPFTAYGQSNAARVIFAKALAEKLTGRGIRVFSIDPGSVATGLQRHFTIEFQQKIAEIRKAGPARDLDGRLYDLPPRTTKSEGAATIITGMIDPTIQSFNGAYLHNNAVADEELHSHILDTNNWGHLWELTEDLVSEKFVV